MRITTALMIAVAVSAAPAVAQETNDAATTAMPADDAAAAPAGDTIAVNTMTTNEVIAPGEATVATPVEPIGPAPQRAEEDGGGFPWGLLGLLGLIGLLGRARSRRSDTD